MTRLVGAARVAVALWKRQHSAKHYPWKKRGSSQAHVAKPVAEHDEWADRHQPDCFDPACRMRNATASRASTRAVFRIDIRRGCRLRDRRPAGSSAEAASVQPRTRLT